LLLWEIMNIGKANIKEEETAVTEGKIVIYLRSHDYDH